MNKKCSLTRRLLTKFMKSHVVTYCWNCHHPFIQNCFMIFVQALFSWLQSFLCHSDDTKMLRRPSRNRNLYGYTTPMHRRLRSSSADIRNRKFRVFQRRRYGGGNRGLCKCSKFTPSQSSDSKKIQFSSLLRLWKKVAWFR